MPKAIATGLRQRDIDVTMPAEVGLLGASDEEQLAYAHREGRVMVTQDQDFLHLHSQGVPHAEIAYYHQGTRTIGQIIRALVSIHDRLSSEEMAGRVECL